MSRGLPLVSIVTQVYNTGKEVVEAMESVRASSYPNWEHILIDDASTDDSVALIEAYCSETNYPCTLVKHKVNQGIAATRREIVSLARGEYIATLSDDLLEPSRLEQDVAFLEQQPNDVCGVFGLAKSFVPGHSSPSKTYGVLNVETTECVFDAARFSRMLLERNPIPAVSMTMRTRWAKTLPNLDDFFIEDYPHWVHLANLGCQFGHRSVVTTRYRDSQISVQKTRSSRVALDALRAKAMLLDNPYLDGNEVQRQLWKWFWSKQLVFDRNHRKEARALLVKTQSTWRHAFQGLGLYLVRFVQKHFRLDR